MSSPYQETLLRDVSESFASYIDSAQQLPPLSEIAPVPLTRETAISDEHPLYNQLNNPWSRKTEKREPEPEPETEAQTATTAHNIIISCGSEAARDDLYDLDFFDDRLGISSNWLAQQQVAVK